jgi:hypothetical protein
MWVAGKSEDEEVALGILAGGFDSAGAEIVRYPSLSHTHALSHAP